MMNWIQTRQQKKDDQGDDSQTKTRRDKPVDNVHISPIAGFIGGIAFLVGVVGASFLGNAHASDTVTAAWVIVWILIGLYIMLALKVAQQWEKAVVLRLGKFRALRGPGMFWIVPIIDSTTTWIDHRVMVTPFNAEKTLTKDTVPVDVDAVLFWVI